jgi:hypothetical protein
MPANSRRPGATARRRRIRHGVKPPNSLEPSLLELCHANEYPFACSVHAEVTCGPPNLFHSLAGQFKFGSLAMVDSEERPEGLNLIEPVESRLTGEHTSMRGPTS